LSVFALLLPNPNSINAIPLGLGEVTTQEILAPTSLTYVSNVMTESEKDLVSENVPLQYGAPNASVARTQVLNIRNTLNFITLVRNDKLSDENEKSGDLSAIQFISLTPDKIEQILSMNEEAWQATRLESISVLEQVMRSTIREDRIDDARKGVPALVSLSLPEQQADLIGALVIAFVAPNSLYSESLTDAQRALARESVEPVTRTFQANQTILGRGQVVKAADLEALDQLGLLKTKVTIEEQFSVLLLVLVNALFVYLYLVQRPDLTKDGKALLLLAILFVLFLFAARLLIPNRTVVPYLIPIAGFSLLINTLVSSRAAILMALPISILAAYGLSNSLELTLYYIFSSIFGVLVARNVKRITTFFWSALAMSVSGSMIILVYRLADNNTDWVGIVSLLGATFFYGLVSAGIALIMQYFFAQLLGLTTAVQLLEVSRSDHPLLQRIIRNAPGTYQHCLQIANLAEQAAEVIGANVLLVRVGALYHDCGKVLNPPFFIENQAPNSPNPHDAITPLNSAQIIIAHVTEGKLLAKEYKLPKRIIDFIMEHHGTLKTSYQYSKALKAADGDESQVDWSDFTYPGPRPQSRETALVMLADGCEARTRAEKPESRQDIHRIVKEMVDSRLKKGQLDDTELTFLDLQKIIESFTVSLQGIHHPRIEYPPDTQPLKQLPEKVETP
jgi:cyclic-di-AMP phosphodiesterase PgpH